MIGTRIGLLFASTLSAFDRAIVPDASNRLAACSVLGGVDSGPFGDRFAKQLFDGFPTEVSETIYLRFFLVIEGETLANYLARKTRLGDKVALEIVRQAACRLEAAWKKLAVHRDSWRKPPVMMRVTPLATLSR